MPPLRRKVDVVVHKVYPRDQHRREFLGQWYNRSYESERRPDAMRNRVRDDVAQPVFLDHRKMINIRVFSRYEPLQQLFDKDSGQARNRA